MRIIAGEWRGRRIVAPADDRVRPTGDRVREAWMSIVGPWIVDADVLDLFAGSGALGLEALSRGAAHADAVEIAPRSLDAIRTNVETLGSGERLRVHRSDAFRFIEQVADPYDIAFADPPYGQRIATRVAEHWVAKPFARILGVEHRVDEHLPESGDRRRYGDTVITFYGLQS